MDAPCFFSETCLLRGVNVLSKIELALQRLVGLGSGRCQMVFGLCVCVEHL